MGAEDKRWGIGSRMRHGFSFDLAVRNLCSYDGLLVPELYEAKAPRL